MAVRPRVCSEMAGHPGLHRGEVPAAVEHRACAGTGAAADDGGTDVGALVEAVLDAGIPGRPAPATANGAARRSGAVSWWQVPVSNRPRYALSSHRNGRSSSLRSTITLAHSPLLRAIRPAAAARTRNACRGRRPQAARRRWRASSPAAPANNQAAAGKGTAVIAGSPDRPSASASAKFARGAAAATS